MLLRYIRWEGEDIVIEMYDVDGSRQAMTLNVPDGLDLAAWLARERNKMLEIMRLLEKRIAEQEEEVHNHE
jgi:hypothetical protein